MASNKNALAMCDTCGFVYPHRIMKMNSYGMLVCPQDWEGQYDLKNHPQNKVPDVRDNPVLSVWPIPENTTDVLYIERISELQDVNKSAIQNADLPKRFLPCLTCGLAYYMSMKRPLVPRERIEMLKINYEETLMRAMLEDREKSVMKVVPRLRYL